MGGRLDDYGGLGALPPGEEKKDHFGVDSKLFSQSVSKLESHLEFRVLGQVQSQ